MGHQDRRAVIRKHVPEALHGPSVGNPSGYDFGRDRKNVEALREILTSTPQRFPLTIAKPTARSAAELKRVVNEITIHFKHLVENCDLSRLLWNDSDPKSEKSAQLVYFGVADSYCKANNIDISPEVHSGGGPVDFKFSTGYLGRLLVEMKLSKGKVVHGYEEQLQTYKVAAQTEEALFLIIDVGRMGTKLQKIQKIRAEREALGERTSILWWSTPSGSPPQANDSCYGSDTPVRDRHGRAHSGRLVHPRPTQCAVRFPWISWRRAGRQQSGKMPLVAPARQQGIARCAD